MPRWAPDSGELFFRSGGSLMVATVHLNSEFSTGEPTELLSFADLGIVPWNASRGANYDISPDGQHFVLWHQIREPLPHSLLMKLNWFEELKERVPTEGSR